MRPLATLDCKDCGSFVISKPESMSIFFDGKDFYAMSICGSCERPVRDDIVTDKFKKLSYFLEHGVKIFSWVDARPIKTLEMIEGLVNAT